MVLARRSSLIAIFALSGLSPAAQESPRTPGTVVLLAAREGHTADDDLRQALLDPDPRTRLVAARVIAAGDHRELLGLVIGALLREQDRDTGAELVRYAQTARVIRRIPYLDAAALWAVTQWEFEPMLVDRTAMPVYVTVTVNFTLK